MIERRKGNLQWQLLGSYVFATTCLCAIVIGTELRTSQSTTDSIQELTRELRDFNRDVCIAINSMHEQSGVGRVVDCNDGRMTLSDDVKL
jgi:hypothetical protein